MNILPRFFQYIIKASKKFALIGAAVITILNALFYYQTIEKDRLSIEKGKLEINDLVNQINQYELENKKFQLEIASDKLQLENLRDQIKKQSVDLDISKSELRQIEPVFEAYYLEIGSSAFISGSENRDWHPVNNEREAPSKFWKFPILKNDVYNDWIRLMEGDSGMKYLVVLVLRQTGKLIARNVLLKTKYVVFSEKNPLNAYVAQDLATNWWHKQLYGKKFNDREINIKLGDLDTGYGILIPLFVHRMEYESGGWNGSIIGSVYTPEKVQFKIDSKTKAQEFDIREILDKGFELTASITIRG